MCVNVSVRERVCVCGGVREQTLVGALLALLGLFGGQSSNGFGKDGVGAAGSKPASSVLASIVSKPKLWLCWRNVFFRGGEEGVT